MSQQQQHMMMGGQPQMNYGGMAQNPVLSQTVAGQYQQTIPMSGQVMQPGQVGQIPGLPGQQPGLQGSSYQSQALQQQMQYQHLQQQHQQQLQMFWQQQMQEVEQANDFKNHQLPLARIKKIMKADEDVRMISAEAPVVFAKACEMFILELTLRSWIHTEENKRRTLQKNDIAGAITRTDIFDFLVDIVPRDELKEEGLGMPRVSAPAMPGADLQYGGMYYVPQAAPAGAPAAAPAAGMQPPPSMMSPQMMVGRPTMQMDPSGGMYQSQRPPMNFLQQQGQQQNTQQQQGLQQQSQQQQQQAQQQQAQQQAQQQHNMWSQQGLPSMPSNLPQ